jgi:uncharacterized phage protein (predicted DNA packaging)
MDELLEKVKLALRIKHKALDDDILDTIQSCLTDLKMHGIVHADETDALIQNAVKLYCKEAYTDDPAKADVFLQRYKDLRDCLKAAEGYGWVDEVSA